MSEDKHQLNMLYRPEPPFIDVVASLKLVPVSVIITCHNYGKYLQECLQSIFTQTAVPQNIIVVDDASIDETQSICLQHHHVKYLRVEFQNAEKARRAGLSVTEDPFVLFVDADNWLPPTYIEQGLTCFTDRTVAGVYSDYICFGDRNEKTQFPCFSRSALFVRNYIDTCSIIRRDALELVIGTYPEVSVIPDDYQRAQALAMEGWIFRKQSAVFYYRCHSAQITEQLRSRREEMPYCTMAGLNRWPLTLFIPLSGRSWAWQKLSVFLERQQYPHDQVQLFLCDTSQCEEFHKQVRQWLSRCDYSDIRHMKFTSGRVGLADENRREIETERAVNLAMCRIYNRMRNEIQTELTWILEDDIIPPDDILYRLMSRFQENVGSVSAPYNSRYDASPVVWSEDAEWNGGTLRCIPKQYGVEQVRGSGFGCLLIRTFLLKQHMFSLPAGVRYYDPEFFKQMGDHWLRLCDWSCWCKHLAPENPNGYV